MPFAEYENVHANIVNNVASTRTVNCLIVVLNWYSFLKWFIHHTVRQETN